MVRRVGVVGGDAGVVVGQPAVPAVHQGGDLRHQRGDGAVPAVEGEAPAGRGQPESGGPLQQGDGLVEEASIWARIVARLVTGSATSGASVASNVVMSAPRLSRSAWGRSTRVRSGELGVVLVRPGRGADRARSVARRGRAAVSSARTARTSAQGFEDADRARGRRQAVLDLQVGVGPGSGGGQHVPHDPVVELGSSPACRRATRSSTSMGRRRRSATDTGAAGRCAADRVVPGHRAAMVAGSGSTPPASVDRGLGLDRGGRARRCGRPGPRCTATRWVSPTPDGGVWTTSGSGGKLPSIGVQGGGDPVEVSLPAWCTPSARARSPMRVVDVQQAVPPRR